MRSFSSALHVCRKLLGPKGRQLPRVPFTEHCYRLFWIGRHDVFRLLMSLCNVIDGRAWLLSEKNQVLLLFDLIKGITGTLLSGLKRNYLQIL